MQEGYIYAALAVTQGANAALQATPACSPACAPVCMTRSIEEVCAGARWQQQQHETCGCAVHPL